MNSDVKFRKCNLFQLVWLYDVHIPIVEILTGHSPDKDVVGCPCSRVNRPIGRNDSLFVGHPDVTGLLRLTHKMADGLTIRYVEIEVNLHPAAMRMGRHGVPDTAWTQFRHSHLQLAGFEDLADKQLIDLTLIGG